MSAVNSRRRDWLRLTALLPLFVLAAFGHRALTVDVENLAMKSTGTDIAAVADLREREFGANPSVVLLARPRVQDLLVLSDEHAIGIWADQLRVRPEVVRVDEAAPPAPGNRCLSVELRAEPGGRYADVVESFSHFARESLPPTYRLAISGFPVIEVAIAESLVTEQKRIIPALIAALALVLALVYRSPVLVIGALVAPLSGLYLLEGFEGLLGLAINPISGLLGPTVLTVGVATSVHVLERYLHELRSDRTVAEASAAAARHLRVPFLLALCTTVAGFLGLLTNPIPAVRHFGLLAPLGVLLATGMALLVLPSVLRLLHRPGDQVQWDESARGSILHARVVQRWGTPIIAAAILLVLISAGGLRESHVSNDLLNVLPANHRARIETATIAETMGGSQTVEVLLPPSTRRAGARKVGPLALAALMQQIGELDGIVSPAAPPRVSRAEYGLVSFVMAPSDSHAQAALFDSVLQVARDSGWRDAEVTGLAAHIAKDSNALVRGQREGILATALGLWLVMTIGFRSWKMGLLGLVPNILPLILINGTLAQLGRPLTVASSMIGTVMLGLVVDDTIHWLHAYREARGRSERRIARAFREVRRAIVITTLVLVVGFSATLWGELPPTREFGILAVATLVIALVADLFLLPALILSRGMWQARRGSASRERSRRSAAVSPVRSL